jgi:hypothetical protein
VFVPKDLSVDNFANVSPVGTIDAEPLAKLFGIGCSSGTLPGSGAYFEDLDSQGIPWLGTFNPNRPCQCIAVRHLEFVSPIIVRADLAGEGVLGFHEYRFTRLNTEARLGVSAEFVVEGALR